MFGLWGKSRGLGLKMAYEAVSAEVSHFREKRERIAKFTRQIRWMYAFSYFMVYHTVNYSYSYTVIIILTISSPH